MILSMEPMEALRYLPFLSPEGVIVTAMEPYKNIPGYPDGNELINTIKRSAPHVLVETEKLAKDAGSAKTYNVVMLGAASPYLGIDTGDLERAIAMFFFEKR